MCGYKYTFSLILVILISEITFNSLCAQQLEIHDLKSWDTAFSSAANSKDFLIISKRDYESIDKKMSDQKSFLEMMFHELNVEKSILKDSLIYYSASSNSYSNKEHTPISEVNGIFSKDIYFFLLLGLLIIMTLGLAIVFIRKKQLLRERVGTVNELSNELDQFKKSWIEKERKYKRTIIDQELMIETLKNKLK